MLATLPGASVPLERCEVYYLYERRSTIQSDRMFIVRDNSFENEKSSLFRNTVLAARFDHFKTSLRNVTPRLNLLNLNVLINLRYLIAK